MPNTKIPYLAGFFDGEGCVYILRATRGQRVQFSLEISFTSSDLAPLLLAQELFLGKISASRDSRPDRKPVYRLRIRSNQAQSALQQMLPFLMVKRERAVLAIDFQERIKAVKGVSIRRLSVSDCEQFKRDITAQNDKSPQVILAAGRAAQIVTNGDVQCVI